MLGSQLRDEIAGHSSVGSQGRLGFWGQSAGPGAVVGLGSGAPGA
jgi:hypothetical protein